MNLDPYLTPDTKNNSNWSKEQNVGAQTLKLVEENSINLHDRRLGNVFLDVTNEKNR